MASVSGRDRDWLGTNKGEGAVRSMILHGTRKQLEGHHGRKGVGEGMDAGKLEPTSRRRQPYRRGNKV